MRSPFVLLSGLPGTGKTHYACELERRGWLRLSVDEQGAAQASLTLAWNDVLSGDDGRIEELRRTVSGIVVEWGFHVIDLPRLRSIVQRGHTAWYLDGDPAAAFQSWRQRWRDRQPDQNWHLQAALLAQARRDIEAIYGERIIRTISASAVGPVHMTAEAFFAAIGVETDSP